MNSRIRLAPALLVVLALAPAATAQLPANFQARTVVPIGSSGNEPVALAFTPGGDRLYFNLRGGTVRIYDLGTGTLQPTPFASLPVTTSGERGLLGLALDPDFGANGYVYVWQDDPSGAIARIVRFTDVSGTGQSPTTILDNIPQGGIHNGGILRFGPDGLLHWSLGDRASSANAQSTAVLPGKIHRVTRSGAPAPGNPFGNSIYSFGLRNNFGFAFSPVTRVIFETEPGPATDELNRIPGPGANMGWPIELGPGPDPTLLDPIFVYPGTPTPVGLDFYYGSGWPASFVGDLFTIDYTGGALRRFVLAGAPDTVVASVSLFHATGSSGFAVAMGPGGALWYTNTAGIRRIVYTAALPDLDLVYKGTAQVGKGVSVHLVHGEPGWLAVLMLGFSTIAPIPFPWGNLLVYPDLEFFLGPFPASGVKTVVFDIPPDPLLAGATAHFQGAEILDATTGSVTGVLSITVAP